MHQASLFFTSTVPTLFAASQPVNPANGKPATNKQIDPAMLQSHDSGASFVASMERLFDSVMGMFQTFDPLANPKRVVECLQEVSGVWAMIFLVAGGLTMVSGYRFYKPVTICLALVMGSFIGYWAGMKLSAPIVLAGCVGLLLAVVAFPLMKYMVAAFGGLAGAFVGANMWRGVAELLSKSDSGAALPADAYWVGAMIGLLICGVLAFLLFKLTVVVFTSVGGATFMVLGGLALLLGYEPWRQPIVDQLTANSIVLPMLVFIPALIGLILQETQRGTAAEPA